MTITSAQFTDPTGTALKIAGEEGQTIFTPVPIPSAELQAEYDAWIAAGNTAAPYVAPPAPVPPPVVRPAISDRQFFHMLARGPYSYILQEEALAAVKTGEIPTVLLNLIDNLEANELLPEGMTRFDIEMMVSGATTFERLHPVTALIAAAFGWTDQELDLFWDRASQL